MFVGSDIYDFCNKQKVSDLELAVEELESLRTISEELEENQAFEEKRLRKEICK